ncbi:pseudouridine synthase [Pseudogracilibacillus sp. SO30301A]|uniref:pseudouridine synthase n=1 Tax=Pseudogracilibacillus sp. SO30301A TaxID=3098291 RepID=UPI00300E0054
MMTNFERLQKVIAQSGLTSRRKAEDLILDGRVKVNNKVITRLGTKVSQKDEITVDEIPLEKEKLVYYVLYKPRGYITSVKDDKDRETVIDLMESIPERIFPIGRLDYNTSGVLLLTNDGDFAHLLMHPKHEIEKVYIAKIKGIPKKESLNQLVKGVKDKNDLLKAVNYKVISVDKRKQTMVLELVLYEGKNRHIRRMMEQIGHPVTKLKREKYGPITVHQLQPGKYRHLTRQEIHQLTTLASKNVKQ